MNEINLSASALSFINGSVKQLGNLYIKGAIVKTREKVKSALAFLCEMLIGIYVKSSTLLGIDKFADSGAPDGANHGLPKMTFASWVVPNSGIEFCWQVFCLGDARALAAYFLLNAVPPEPRPAHRPPVRTRWGRGESIPCNHGTRGRRSRG